MRLSHAQDNSSGCSIAACMSPWMGHLPPHHYEHCWQLPKAQRNMSAQESTFRMLSISVQSCSLRFDRRRLDHRKALYHITSGAFKGQRGFFTRDESGTVVGVDLAGRLFNRIPD
jgi:hypothetical protein